MKATLALTLSSMFSLLILNSARAQEVGSRTFLCTPVEAYELTAEGLRMASEESYNARVTNREFYFDEVSGIKSEPQSGKSAQYTIINADNLLGSPVVAQYGSLNPTFLRIQMIDQNDPSKFVFILFAGGMNIFGHCAVQ